MRISFLGLGNMGAPLAANMLKAGETLTIFSRHDDQKRIFKAKGARVAESLQDLTDCDALFTCLPMPGDVLDVAVRKDNLYALMPKGAIHVDLSTIGPEVALTLQKKAGEYGLGYVQATMSKTPESAERGETPFLVGGGQAAVEKILPVLGKIGRPHNVGSVNAACAIKLISNLIGMSNVAILAEGMRIGKLAGIEADELLSLLLDTGAASYQMKVRGPWMVKGDYDARFAMDLAAKDLRLGCAMAREWGYQPKMMSQALAYLQDGQLEDMGREDVAALCKVMR